MGGAGYRERTVKTGKFRGKTGGEFIAWCMMLCDEFPDCSGFEIGDGGNNFNKPGDNKLTKPNSLCSLKNKVPGSVSVPENTAVDCFTALRVVPEKAWREVMEKAPGCNNCVPELKNVYPGVGCVGNENKNLACISPAGDNPGQTPK